MWGLQVARPLLFYLEKFDQIGSYKLNIKYMTSFWLVISYQKKTSKTQNLPKC